MERQKPAESVGCLTVSVASWAQHISVDVLLSVSEDNGTSFESCRWRLLLQQSR